MKLNIEKLCTPYVGWGVGDCGRVQKGIPKYLIIAFKYIFCTDKISLNTPQGANKDLKTLVIVHQNLNLTKSNDYI